MPAVVCPRCQRVNPDYALYCFHDGAELRPSADGVSRPPIQQLPLEFVFPFGRRCRSYDELAQGCQEEWEVARELLGKGALAQYFGNIGRHDLARAAQEALHQGDPDIALTTFLAALPVSPGQQPRLDLNPRRLLLGAVLAGETRQVQMTVSNQGEGVLQGTLKISEGGQWLRLGGEANPHQCTLRAAKEQPINLQIDTRGLPAGQTYGGRLTVITNGGVVEVPVRLELVPQRFATPPFQGVKAPREMAEKMRVRPKAAGPLLESGEVARWFAANGWVYPVRGSPAKGVAAVQQFFEAMGLSRPPKVQLNPPEVRLQCRFLDSVRGQAALHTPARKWVYAAVESPNSWLKVLTPFVAGPQQATIAFEAVSQLMPPGNGAQGELVIHANAGQDLTLRVVVEVRGGPKTRKQRPWLAPIVALIAVAALLRLLLIPMVDLVGRPGAARAAAIKVVGHPPAAGSPLLSPGGWLQIPWSRLLSNREPRIPLQLFKPDSQGMLSEAQAYHFRDYFASYLLRGVLLGTFWVGGFVGGWLVWQRSGQGDLWWGVIAGLVAGCAVGATLASLVLVIDLPAHLVWDLVVGQGVRGVVGLGLWLMLVLCCWALIAGLAGVCFYWIQPLKQALLLPLAIGLAWVCRKCRLRHLARFFTPS